MKKVEELEQELLNKATTSAAKLNSFAHKKLNMDDATDLTAGLDDLVMTQIL
jgi:hypothetical protein